MSSRVIRGACIVMSLAPFACSLLPHSSSSPSDRRYLLEQVDDVGIVQCYADGFANLTTKDKILAWHLTQAALAGRDIYFDQRCRFGLEIRDLIEEMLVHPDGIDAATLENVRHYAKLFWINNSPYNAQTARKNVMGGTPEALAAAAERAEKNGAKFRKQAGESARDHVKRLTPILFDPNFEPMVTAKNPEGGKDIVEGSAVNFYSGVTLAEVNALDQNCDMNSSVVKRADGTIVEEPWRMGDPSRGIPPGRYAKEIGAIVSHLEAALPYATEPTRKALEALVRYYRSGSAEDFRAYNIAWVADKDSVVDTVNGFIEVYMDPRGIKAGWEGIVSYEDPKKAELIKRLGANAQWFEDRMPYDAAFKKPEVKGISARSIDVVFEGGDSGPVTPVGINLPNPQDIREEFGSKSVSLANIVEGYAQSEPAGAKYELCSDDAERARLDKWGQITSELLTNMHEVIGHASGRQAADKQGDPATWIREYYSALEEARADLVALWFMPDPKLKELGLLDDPEEAARAQYEKYTRNGGLGQLRRVKHGDQIEEDHMRNRQMVVRWIQANSSAIEEVTKDGKRYIRVKDAKEWHAAAGRLLALVQKLKSTGDYEGAKKLFNDYGIKFDTAARDEIVARYAKLKVPAYSGFVYPRLSAVKDASGAIVDVKVDYPMSIEDQMLEWSGRK